LREFNEGNVFNEATTDVNSPNGLLLMFRVFSFFKEERSLGKDFSLLFERSRISRKGKLARRCIRESISSRFLLSLLIITVL